MVWISARISVSIPDRTGSLDLLTHDPCHGLHSYTYEDIISYGLNDVFHAKYLFSRVILLKLDVGLNSINFAVV